MPDSRRPNILWIIAEDFGPALSCMGRTDLRTPRIDALAGEGILFTRCHTTAPVCSPSRSAFLTGMYQTTIGAHDHRSHRDDFHPLPSGVRTAPEWFRAAGYATANLVHLPLPFRGTGKTDWNFAAPARPFEHEDWKTLRADGRPFFAMLNLWETHRPFEAPRVTDPARFDLPPFYPDHPRIREDTARYLDSALALDRKVGQMLDLLDAEGLRDNTVVFFMGDNGEAHIRGKQFCYDEGLHVPLVVSLPSSLRRYGRGVSRRTDRLVEAIDWLPTSLALAGVRVPAGMQGRPFLGPGAGQPRRYAFAARDRCDETVIRLRTVRDARYRWIRNLTPDKGLFEPNAYKAAQYPAWNLVQDMGRAGKLEGPARLLVAPRLPATALFDLETDPHALVNLADDPAHRAVRERLDRALREWMRRSGDPHAGLLP
ncbi:MAG: sulfatase [Armatimonadota bacterium]